MKKIKFIFSFIFVALISFSAIFNIAYASDPTPVSGIEGGAKAVNVDITRSDGKLGAIFTAKLTAEGATAANDSLDVMVKFRKLKTDQKVDLTFGGSDGVLSLGKCKVPSTAKAGDTVVCNTAAPTGSGLPDSLTYGSYVFVIATYDHYLMGFSVFTVSADNGKAPFSKDVTYKKGDKDINTTGDVVFGVKNGVLGISTTLNEGATKQADGNKIYLVYGTVGDASDMQNNIYLGAQPLSDWVKQDITTGKGSGTTILLTGQSQPITTPGRYFFGILISEDNTLLANSTWWASPFYEFDVTDPSISQLQLSHPIETSGDKPENVSVKIKVNVPAGDSHTIGSIQLGHVSVDKGLNAPCVLDPALTMDGLGASAPDGVVPYIETEFTGSKFTFAPGIYCIGAKIMGMDDYLIFTGPKDFFPLLGVIVPDNLSINPNANANGCVANGTGEYCLLVPLPGVGDNDVTGHLDTTTGIGDYVNSMIRLIIGLIAVISVVMIVVGGIQYMSTINMGEKNDAKRRITHALFGLALAVGSYAILNTINPNLVSVTIHIPNANLGGTDEGDVGDQEDPLKITNPNPIPDMSIPSGDAQSLAKQILDNGNITLLDSIPKHNETISGPKQNIKDTADGKAAHLSSWANGGSYAGKTVALSSEMLAGMLAVGNLYKIQVNAIAGGDHANGSPPSRHYSGIAFDVQSAPSEIARTKQVLDACMAAGADYNDSYGPCDNVLTSKVCAKTNYKTNKDHQTHIHCGWPRSAASTSGSGSSDQTNPDGTVADACKPLTETEADSIDCEGLTDKCSAYAKIIDAKVSDSGLAKFMKVNMVEESGCKISATSRPTVHGYAYGIFQQHVDTAQGNISGCGVSANEITPEWLKNEANVSKDICIQKNFIKSLMASHCGTDWRNVAAGQNGGAGRCNASVDCTTETSCIPGNKPVQQWECPWDNTKHTKVNTGLKESRWASRKVMYCMSNPGSWMQ